MAITAKDAQGGGQEALSQRGEGIMQLRIDLDLLTELVSEYSDQNEFVARVFNAFYDEWTLISDRGSGADKEIEGFHSRDLCLKELRRIDSRCQGRVLFTVFHKCEPVQFERNEDGELEFVI